jgi:protein-tyrosine kinase
MSRLCDALRRMEAERRTSSAAQVEPIGPMELIDETDSSQVDLRQVPSARVAVSAESRLAALTDPQGLGAEKFRALATRLEHLRHHQELRSFQVTSGLAHEGKTLVAANLAVTFAQSLGTRVFLIEGDMHRPSLSPLLGLAKSKGISHWWLTRDADISSYLTRLGHMPLWFLSAGSNCEQPSYILQSARFAEALFRIMGSFDWIIVDSTPMLPFADSNLWSRILDGTLLVVREGVASGKALKKGLEAIDNPNVLGIVLNDAPDIDHINYEDQYYALPKAGKIKPA